jgi:peptidyl-prolyl cis-trans isomerase SurA
MWQPAVVLKRRAARLVTTGLLLAAPVFGLTACRTSPDVAAYVGDSEVTVAELEAAIEERTSNDAIAAVAESEPANYRRYVLNTLIQAEVHAAAAERYGVEVDADDVRNEIDDLLGDQDPEAAYEQLAQQGTSEADVFENVRQRLIRREVAEAEEVEELEEPALQDRYEETSGALSEYLFGFITVPDQATADSVLAQLTAAPDSYAAVAAQYPGENTLPELQRAGADQLPQVLADGITGAEPGTGFVLPVDQAGGVVVTFVADVVTPSFEEQLPQLEVQAADEAGIPLVNAVRDDLDVTVNPRFGAWDGEQVVEGDGGVVEVLEDVQ